MTISARHILWLAFLAQAAFPSPPTGLQAQTVTVPPAFEYVTVAPSGACVGTPPIQIVYFTGAAYVCANGTWTTIGGSGSGGGAQLPFPGLVWATSLTGGTTATSAQVQSVIGAGVYAPTASPAFTGTPTAPTQSCGNNTNIATGAYVAACGGSGAVSGQASGVIPIGSTATTIGGQSHLDDGVTTSGVITSSEPTTVNVVSPSFTTGSSIFQYNNTAVGGCSVDTDYHSVQFNHTVTAALTVCNHNATGTGSNDPVAMLVTASSSVASVLADAILPWAFTTVNSGKVIASNPLAQDVAGLTSGVSLVGEEIDVQPYNGTSTYSQGAGLDLALINNTNQGGTFPFPAIQMDARVNGGSTPAYWRYGLFSNTGSLGTSSVLFNIGAIGTATSGANSNCPVLLNAYEAYWTGSANAFEGWTMGCNVGTGTNPATDKFYLGHTAGTAPGGQIHTFELLGGIQMQLDGSTSGSTVLSTSATGGTLNLGSTNATVDISGNMTVASCVGCASSTVPTLYSGSVIYAAGQIAYDGSGNNYSSLSSGNVGNAQSNATFWHFLGGVSTTITGGNCVTAGQFVSGISTVGVPTCGTVVPRAALTFTSATTDAATVTGVLTSSLCTFSATNATAATNIATTYISTIASNSVTITHVTGASGGTVSIVCSPN